MPYARNGRVKLHWEQHGEGDPLVLIMGHVFPAELWYPVLPALAAHRRVITFDNRGTGRSAARRDHTIADMCDDVLAVMDAAGVDKADVFGVSMGGGIAMELARRAPSRVNSLVLGCTRIKTEPAPISRRGRLLYLVPYRWLTARSGPSGYGSACPTDKAERDLAVLAAMRYSRTGAWAQSKAIARYALPLTEAAKIRQPALVLHGDEDGAISLEESQLIAETLPDARWIVYPGAGHNFLVGYAEQVVTDVLQFLSSSAPLRR
jgi:pimeloyl-ACP methyl ester carboxylesterase